MQVKLLVSSVPAVSCSGYSCGGRREDQVRIQQSERKVVRGEFITISTEAINTQVEMSGGTPELESISWTRQVDGSYSKEGNLPANTPAVRIFSIDEDYERNPNAICPGLKLRPKDEAVALVEGKIAEGSYRAWRYEIRLEKPEADDPLPPIIGVPAQPTEPHTCSNSNCKKGPGGSRGSVTRRNAKYCCPSCRVSGCRQKKPKPLPPEKTKIRKPRCDKKYPTHAARQYAYDYRKWGTVRGRHAIDRLLGKVP